MKSIYIVEYMSNALKTVITAIDDISLLDEILNDCHKESRLNIKKVELIEALK